ncbi:enoyl-CoA hydratase [Litorimonas taeanensis]|uniref:Enoyl-CoA hydratase n=1 Tax=Litorimonas taeanensis TaxID=568099 RepID=A0A420WD52_9PROT|nr:enoyl-CoA hydratase-related protein [Litorimonas taeanensis]RKQ68913.1 enoyl-CoA hydratase [Litorimonas taeanensis]
METLNISRDVENSSVAILTLNRPEAMNSFNIQMCEELIEAYKTLDADRSVRIIVVTGAGRAFCAGADISQGFATVAGANYHEGVARDRGGELVLSMYDCETPIIGAINGAAVGIGATMLLPMDLRIASVTSKFAFPFARRGIAFDGASSWFLPRLVGFAKAQEWILKGSILKADELVSAGLISELKAPEEVLPHALNVARDIAQNCSPTSTINNKRLLRHSMQGFGAMDEAPFKAHIEESVLLEKAFVSEDCREGVTAFFEKRSPEFKDYSE